MFRPDLALRTILAPAERVEKPKNMITGQQPQKWSRAW
jgi:hypothetical protein